MKKKIIFFLIVISTFCELFFIHKEASGQMRVAYPRRFSVTGLIELTYKDYSTEVSDGRHGKYDYSVLQQRYSLGLKGYVYDPRLIVFSTRVTFVDERMLKSTSNFKYNSKDMIYEISAIFLPYRPISLTAYAERSDYTLKGLNGGRPYDYIINNYGALLGINLRKYPSISLEYYHLDITPTGTQINKTKTENDTYSLHIRGKLNFLRTDYGLNLGISDISSPVGHQENKYIDISANTSLKIASLLNMFRYQDTDFSKSYGFYSNLQFSQGVRFFHEYMYSYDQSKDIVEDQTIKSVRHDLTGFYRYRFTNNFTSSLTVNYGQSKLEKDKWKYYAVGATLTYSRPIKNYHFASYYRFGLKNDEKKGDYQEHTINLELTTRKLRWGKIYTSYSFTFLKGTFKFEEQLPFGFNFIDDMAQEILEGKYTSTSHAFAIGARGRALRKLTWSLEAEYLYSRSITVRPKTGSFNNFGEPGSDILTVERKRKFYVLVGELFYPFGRGAMLNLRSGYNFGELDSKSTDKMFYELKLNWTISRRLNLIAWWRQAWYKVEGSIDRKTKEYNVTCNYLRGRTYFTAEYWVQNEEEDSANRKYTRFLLKVRRNF